MYICMQLLMSPQQLHRMCNYENAMSFDIIFMYFTLIPVLVASFTAARRLSYLGLNDTVKAQSIILPKKNIKKILINLQLLQYTAQHITSPYCLIYLSINISFENLLLHLERMLLVGTLLYQFSLSIGLTLSRYWAKSCHFWKIIRQPLTTASTCQ